MRQYISITEHNDNEGESWRFWIPSDDPMLENAKKVALINEDFYEINENLVPGSEVDLLCEHSREGYMPFENKVDHIDWPENVDFDHDDPLYKGGCYRI